MYHLKAHNQNFFKGIYFKTQTRKILLKLFQMFYKLAAAHEGQFELIVHFYPRDMCRVRLFQ